MNTLEKDSLHPDEAQRRLLMRILRKSKDAEYGREHAFSEITDIKSFRRNLPLSDYAALEPCIDRMKRGEQGILTSEKVCLFARTSGTTANPKYIPATASARRRTGALMSQWLEQALIDHPSFMDKGFLMIAGAAIEGRLDSGIPYGSASGMIYANLPMKARQRYAIPLSLSKISDYGMRYYLMARLSLGKPISFIATPSPLTLLKLAEASIASQEEIVRSVHNGWLSDRLRTASDCIDAGVPPSVCAGLSPDRKRARLLSNVIEKHGRLCPSQCWPELSLIGCWLGGSVGFHADALEQYYGKTPKRDIGYMASEGCFNLPCQNETPSGLLALRNNYYEFIPETQSDSSSPDILSASEVKEGACYKILLTNESGLYRYDIKDIVRVDGFRNRTPLISFVRKDSSFLNIAGEKLHINHFLEAINELNAALQVDIRQFRIVPDCKNLRYDILLDIRTPSSPGFITETLRPALDALLRKSNVEYESKRKSGRLNAPRIHVMEPAWEENTRKANAELSGRRDIQHKWLHISGKLAESDKASIKFTVD